MEDIQALLQAAFADELSEHLAGMRAALAAQEAGQPVDLREFFRRAHSLKGAARAVEQPETERLAHALETLLEAIARGDRALDAETVPQLRVQIDAIEDAAGAAVSGGYDDIDALPEAVVRESGGDDMLRVSARAVEALTRSLHGVLAEVQGRAAVTEGLVGIAAELEAVAAMLVRGDADGAARQVTRTQAAAGRMRRAQGRADWAMDRAVAALEADSERVLMVPAQMLFDGYDRMLREVAQSQGKSASLHIEGSETAADRRVLQMLRDPMLHMLRNAVGHGIETAERRRAAGKPERGSVTATVQAARGQLILSLTDNGAGLDDAAIERRARAAGLIAAGSATPPLPVLRAMVFEQGFSTAAAVDEVSGRGVGLSVVADAARRLQGSVTIAPADGGGTVVTLAVPLSMSRQTMLLVECAGATYAVPVAAVRRVMALDPGAVTRGEDGQVAVIDGAAVPLVALSAVLGTGGAAGQGALSVLWMRSGIALTVDALLAVRSLVVGDPGAIAVDLPWVAGTVLLDDGAVALVLGADVIAARALGSARGVAVVAEQPAAARRLTVLVVDDSITTRTLERGILEAAGYAVRLAVDGLAGLERLRAEAGEIDLVVADVEMPRMDGFGLLTAVRNDPALRGIPVVMMTSRNSPDDIERGLDLGANAYVTKQDFEQGKLLSIIGQLI
ncbi:hybrid sensor histidine kinase/response regulator [Sphingomonas prati]|uniref:Chemotaxis protein CheA n=1 Tax=Sphingomonas prati TaxID=1843237 RepID=A0A7W9BTY1_9SPHN|nr:response regulator [Sphingomonas prati]MBB5729940.1 two-component system chemotaxis sensor kinase CheA [Sphingomonas prati]GGE88321.1 transcriptional regulator [Sphingomonas prati]